MRRVAGKAVDGSMISAFINGVERPITKIEYEDSLTPATITPLGSQELEEMTDGKYETSEKSFEMTVAAWSELLNTFPNGFGNLRFPIVVRAADPDLNPLTSLGSEADTLEGCKITKVGKSYVNDESVAVVPVSFKPLQILWGGKSINRRKGLPL